MTEIEDDIRGDSDIWNEHPAQISPGKYLFTEIDFPGHPQCRTVVSVGVIITTDKGNCFGAKPLFVFDCSISSSLRDQDICIYISLRAF